MFDVDGCLVDSLTGTSLRPGAAALLGTLRARGQRIILWSAGGTAHARRRAAACEITGLVDDFAEKDGRDEHGRYRPDALGLGAAAVVFVDDRPEDMPVGADVRAVSPYLAPNPHDRVLVSLAASLEVSDDSRCRRSGEKSVRISRDAIS